MYIYCITNKQNLKKYIGCTTRNPYKRWNEHIYKKINFKSALKEALDKYGITNFSFKVIDKASSNEEMFKLEKYYIIEFDSFNKGYNLTRGGDCPPIERTKKHRENISIALIGRKFTEERKQNISKSLIGRKISKEHKEKITKPKYFIEQYDKDFNLLNIYFGSVDAQKHTNIDASAILKVCKNKRKSAGGYIWRYM